ncbi:MAG: hypothetical protein LBU68_00790 [Rickettsiales bacterium]|jgi:hypothetical protein|nr:hypothetical protein [Rickettsiales bacterium]
MKRFGLAFISILFVIGFLFENSTMSILAISDTVAQTTSETSTTTGGGYNPSTIAETSNIFGWKLFSADKVYECSECNIITPLFMAVSQLTYIIYKFFTPYLLIMMAMFFGYWMLLFMWGKLKPGEAIATNFDFMKDIIKRILKILVVFVVLTMSPQFVMRWTVGPMMDMATFVSNKFVDISRIATGNQAQIQYTDTNYKLTGIAAEQQAFPDELRDNLLSIMKNYSSIYRYGMAFGMNMVIAITTQGLTVEGIIMLAKFVVKKAIVIVGEIFGIPGAITERIVNFLDKVFSKTAKIVGILYLIVALIGAMIFTLYALVALKILTVVAGFILNMGLAVILIPFALVSWAFKDYNIEFLNSLGLFSKVKNIFVGWSANLAMMTIVMTFCTFIIESLLMTQSTIAGQVMTLKEYILTIGDPKNILLGGPGILKILWQNMDISLVFLCFGWVVSYLIKNVPAYTEWFFVGVENSENNIWKLITGLFNKLSGVAKSAKNITGVAIEGIANSITGGDGTDGSRDDNDEYPDSITPERTIIQNMHRISAALRMYASAIFHGAFNKMRRYSDNLEGENIEGQKKKFSKKLQKKFTDNPDLKDKNGEDILVRGDKEEIENYANNKDVNIKDAYDKLHEKGKVFFIETLMGTYSENDNKNLARLIVANEVENDFNILDDKEKKDVSGGNNKKDFDKYIDKKTKEEIEKKADSYADDIKNNLNLEESELTRKMIIDAMVEINEHKNIMFDMTVGADGGKKRKFPENRLEYATQTLKKILIDLMDNSATEKALLEEDIATQHIDKMVVIEEQKSVIKMILDNLDKSSLSVEEKNLLRRRLEGWKRKIDDDSESMLTDMENNANSLRLDFYKELMKDHMIRRFLRELHLEKEIASLVKYIEKLDDSDLRYDLDGYDDENENNDDEFDDDDFDDNDFAEDDENYDAENEDDDN